MNNVLDFKELKKIASEYMETANLKWGDITSIGYLCYENDLELANEIIYKLFDKDIFNDTATYYKQVKNDYGYTFKVLCELEENIYFQFDIITRYGIDIPQRINNGKFRILKQAPKGWKDVWELWQKLEEESEE